MGYNAYVRGEQKEEEKKKKKKKAPMSDAKKEKTSNILSKAADLASTIAGASPTKWRGPVDTGTPVQSNDKPPKGMDLSVAYDNKSPLPDDDMEYQQKKKMYGL